MLRTLLAFIAVSSLLGCANRERIVLLPGPDGKVGTVVVQGPNGENTLNSAYGAVEVKGGRTEAQTLSKADVEQRYKAALNAMPPRPVTFNLFFVFDKVQMTQESAGSIAAIISEFNRRPAAEAVVIGYADKTGESQYNENLSRKRAESIRDLLVREGIPKEALEVQWRGDRQAASSAGKADANNRRVEVKIR